MFPVIRDRCASAKLQEGCLAGWNAELRRQLPYDLPAAQDAASGPTIQPKLVIATRNTVCVHAFYEFNDTKRTRDRDQEPTADASGA